MRTITRISVLILLLFVSGCNNGQKSIDSNMHKDSPPPYSKTADDIIDTHGMLENKERLDEFFNNVQQGKDDHIRVVKYTIEGDPIIYSYELENKVINVTIDTTRDAYGHGEIVHKTCTSMMVNEETEKTSYVLDGCTPSVGDHIILTIE